MCMYDLGDGWAVHTSRMHRARRPTHCNECGRIIEAGEQYEYNTGILNDCSARRKWTSSKTCAHCLIAREWLGAVCGGWLYCGVHEDIDEHVRESEEVSCFALVLIDSWMRRDWRKKDGTMHSLAEVRRLTDYAIGHAKRRIERAAA